jgi:hypothetical protein
MPMRRVGLTVFAALSIGGCGGDGVGQPSLRDDKERSLVFKLRPYMGVACRTPNSIRCDRVGLAVRLADRAERLTATIAGRAVVMKQTSPFNESGQGWEGFLRPAGLLDGPLRVRPDSGRYRWHGQQRAPVASVRLTASYSDGRSAARTVRVTLAPGWG